MTTLAHTPVPGTAPAARPRSTTRPVTFPRVVNAEWIKFRTLRSSRWSLGVYVALMVGLSVLMAWASTLMIDEGMEAGATGATILSAGSQMGQLVVVVLGVLAVTGEYSTGLVRSSFAAVPRRVPVLAAKAVVLAAVVAVATVLSQALAFVATLPFHSQLGITIDLGAAETPRLLLGLPLYMVAIALFGLGVGALLRHTAGAITTVVALLLVVETVISLVPLRVFELISPFLPATAGSRVFLDTETLAMIDQMSDAAHLAPWQGYGVLVAWVAVLLLAAAVLLRRRDT